ncbi:MAG: YkgJ family cysteine cluster protein [Candidatus Hecatellaceae archaeon]
MLPQNFQSLQLLRGLLSHGKPVPWRLVHDWECHACGDCCTRYVVELKPQEYAQIAHAYGFSSVTVSAGKIYLKRRPDGSCLFLHNLNGRNLCGLQHLKPEACRLWPFNPHEAPVFGHPELSYYRYGRKSFYVYVIPACPGLSYGEPSQRLKEKVIPEILDMKFKGRVSQKYSTSAVAPKLSTSYPPLTVLRI